MRRRRSQVNNNYVPYADEGANFDPKNDTIVANYNNPNEPQQAQFNLQYNQQNLFNQAQEYNAEQTNVYPNIQNYVDEEYAYNQNYQEQQSYQNQEYIQEFSEEDLQNDEEYQKELDRERWKAIYTVLNFLGVIVGVVLIFFLLAVLLNITQWLQIDFRNMLRYMNLK